MGALYLAWFIAGKVDSAFLRYLGRNTIPVAALHLLAFKPLTMLLGLNPTAPTPHGMTVAQYPAYLAIGVLLPLAFVWAKDRLVMRPAVVVPLREPERVLPEREVGKGA